MDDLKQLGGNIDLIGFSALDGGTMFILRKIIGSSARKYSEKIQNFKKLTLKLNNANGNNEITAIITADNDNQSISQDSNTLVAVANVLKELDEKMGVK